MPMIYLYIDVDDADKIKTYKTAGIEAKKTQAAQADAKASKKKKWAFSSSFAGQVLLDGRSFDSQILNKDSKLNIL